MTAWATIQQVTDLTGVTVEATDLAQAQAVIELHVNRTPDAAAAIRARDLYWLRQAVAWQSVWQPQQPGYTARAAVTQVNQDGLAFTHASESSVTLAPLAIRAIRNLSWMGNRSVAVGIASRLPPPAFNLETADDFHQWEPL